MADWEKERRTEIQKFEYLKNKKSFFNEIKAFFIVFEGLSLGEKIKNCDISFNDSKYMITKRSKSYWSCLYTKKVQKYIFLIVLTTKQGGD